MIAYNKEWLYNLFILEQADQALYDQCISIEEHNKIRAAFPANFYTPNIFVRIGLFILTVIIALFSLGLFLLIFNSGSTKLIGTLLIFSGILAYAALEIMVTKNHYKSGVDDGLLWIAPVSIACGFNIISDISWLQNAIIIFIAASFLFSRFTNWIMAGVSAIAFITIIFLSYIKLGEIAKATAPFIVMTSSAVIYMAVTKLLKKEKYKLYSYGLIMASIVTLLCFYIAGNYFAVRETSILMFDLDLHDDQSIPLGWLFWVFTFGIPMAYIIRGIQKKDVVLLRVGLILVAAIVFTVRYYYAVLPLETAAIVAGILLVVFSYVLIRYLREPKHGFTYKKTNDRQLTGKVQIESLIIAETLSTTHQPADNSFQFGGGSGGGAGASGEF